MTNVRNYHKTTGMYKAQFEATMTRVDDGSQFEAIVKIDGFGYGNIYDKQDNIYCGSIAPIRVMLALR